LSIRSRLAWAAGALALGAASALLLTAALSPPVAERRWAAPTLSGPLGYDELGRNIITTLASAALLSLGKATLITAVVLLIAFVLGHFLSRSPHRYLGAGLQLVVNAVESVPPVLWVIAIFAALREPRLALVGLAFGLVTLPAAIALAAGEIRRLRHEPFVETAYGLGLSEWLVTWRHLLPNAAAVLLPFGFQVIGAALAVDGAVGIVGLGSRIDLDLGAFLLRGQENFQQHPALLIATLAVYLAIYAALSAALSRFGRRRAQG